jgi:hypothetical protein
VMAHWVGSESTTSHQCFVRCSISDELQGQVSAGGNTPGTLNTQQKIQSGRGMVRFFKFDPNGN